MLAAIAAVLIALVAGPQEPLAGRTVAIDPGHNGANGAHPERINRHVAIGGGRTKACDTTGTQTTAGYRESRYNLDVARELRRILRGWGAEVVMTRRNDRGVGPCIDRRARLGNAADVAVSIHADGGPPSGRGFHVIYPTRIEGLTDDILPASRILARMVRAAYERRTALPRATYLGGDGLAARSDLGGLRLSDVPKVLIETGNMRSAADARRLSSARFRKRIARGIADGLRRFLLTRAPARAR